MEKSKKLFIDSLMEFGLDISEYQLTQFIKFYDFMIEKNKVMNLTGITEPNEVIVKHFVDSLSLVKIVSLDGVERIIDMGTGAGFPGIPILIMFPQIEVTLMDSLNKRIKFLEEACHVCEISNAKFVHGRAEELGRNSNYREQFDLCVSRAVANLSTLSEYCLPFVKVGGSFICYKSGNSDEEIVSAKNAISILSAKITDRCDFTLPFSEYSRTLLKIDKVNAMKKAYPRRAGTPAKSPLI